MNYKIINHKEYISLKQLVELSGLKKTTLESYRKSNFITFLVLSNHKVYYPITVIDELQEIKGYEELRSTISSKLFKENNLNYKTLSKEIKDDLIKLNIKSLTGIRKEAIVTMILSSTTLENTLFNRFNQFIGLSQYHENYLRLKIGDIAAISKKEEHSTNRSLSQTLDGYKLKYGVAGEKKFNEKKEKTKNSKENFISRHGEVLGLQKFMEFKSKLKHSEERFIEKNGEEEGKLKWKNFLNNIKNTEENFIKKYGEEEGNQLWLIYKEKIKNTKENFILRHGNKLGLEKWESYKKIYGGMNASKQSLEIFEPLTKYLIDKGLRFDEIFYGVKDSFEYRILNDDSFYAYDYTIPKLKIIFEYNGNHVHPSKELLGEKWNDWKNAWTGESADTRFAFDRLKIETAEKEGFTVIEIWDFKDRTESLEQCIRLLEERI